MKTIAAISTPQNAGGIGIIRISGENSIEIVDRIFRPTGKKCLSDLTGYRAAHGFVFDVDEKIDECVATVFRAPKSYTGENVVELSCHGGLYVLKRVLRAVINEGASPAGPGEFTKRAFLNGKIDLTEAEAVMGIISAHGEQGAQASLNALDGALSKKINELNEKLLRVSAQMGAWVDYPDDEIEEISDSSLLRTLKEVETELENLLSKFDAGAAITNGIETAIIGKPNVGKSELMNLLSGFDRSIVTSVAGTTRDTVEQTVTLGSLVLHLADTAGIRETDDLVENIGVERAKTKTDRSTLIIAVFDSSLPFDDYDEKIINLTKDKKAVAVINKTDLPALLDESKIRSSFSETVSISAKSGEGLEELEKSCERLLCTAELDTSQAMLTTERQRKNASDALKAIKEGINCIQVGMTNDAINVCVDEAVSSLLELTGEKTTDAVVDEIFSSFCVGK